MKIYTNVLELIGKTPIIDISNIVQNSYCKIYAKLEYFNPGASVKDRLGLAIIEDAEKKGLIYKSSVIIEATSGNTGIGLALVCAVKKYKLIIVMPENMSVERQKIMKAYGAEIILTPASQGMQGAVNEAQKLSKQIPHSYLASQFTNIANVEMHRKTTAQEIINDTEGKVDIFVSGYGSAGTFTGIAEELKKYNYNIKCIVVEPEESQLLRGEGHYPHKIQGISPGFLPKIFKTELVDSTITVSYDDAVRVSRLLAREFGIFSGISSGANVCAVLKLASLKDNAHKTILTIICDTGERYLSTDLY